MSSGNPFRASQSYKQSPIPQTSFTNSDSSGVFAARKGDSDHVLQGAISTPPKTKKHVRIVSPTTSIPPHPEAFDAYEDDHEFASPSASHAQWSGSAGNHAFSVSPSQSTAAGSYTAQDTQRGYDMAAASAPSASTVLPLSRHQPVLSPSNVPANPFSRILASLEPQGQGAAEDRTIAEGTASGNNRASLDVESFKNLLLTGRPTPRPSVQPAQVAAPSTTLAGSHFESSSSTDTSSISRQSLSEQSHETTHAESPRTSLDIAESEEDESGMSLVPEIQKGKRKPPPAPKHRHGKLVVPRQPQTVSFDDFAASEPNPSPVTRSRENSETVSKPLPPVPVMLSPPPHTSTQDNIRPQSPPIAPKPRSGSIEGESPGPQSTQTKKIPPPVPLARRQSQLRSSSDGNRSRSNSSLTISSQYSIEPLPSPAPSTVDPLLSSKLAPPPPPPRSRHGAKLANISTSSANSSSTELPRRAGSVRDPATRNALSSIEKSEPSSPVLGVHRTSSVSSNRNSIRAVSGESTASVSMPPPPPPPRRRQSNRSSLDGPRPTPASPSESRRTSTEYRRTSTEYRRTSFDSKRRTSAASESSLRKEYAPAVDSQTVDENALYSPREESENTLGAAVKAGEERSDSNSILDDMEKFQREIDELRNRYKQVG